jgi:hypothetical protein
MGERNRQHTGLPALAGFGLVVGAMLPKIDQDLALKIGRMVGSVSQAQCTDTPWGFTLLPLKPSAIVESWTSSGST